MPLTPSQSLIYLVLNGYQSQRTAILERLSPLEGVEIEWGTEAETLIYVFLRLFYTQHRRAPESYEVVDNLHSFPEVLDYLVSLSDQIHSTLENVLAGEEARNEVSGFSPALSDTSREEDSNTERPESEEQSDLIPGRSAWERL